MAGMTEADWEHHLLDQLAEWGWDPVKGRDLAPRTGERSGWDDLIIEPRLRSAIHGINPGLPDEVVDEAVVQIRRRTSQDAFHENALVHKLLTRGVKVTYTGQDGRERTPTVWVLNFADPLANEFLVANQVTISDGRNNRRLDAVCYVNGLPLAVFELKAAGSEDSSQTAYFQLRTYLREFGATLFAIPQIAVASDGVTALIGTPFTKWEHMAPWNLDEQGNRTNLQADDALDVLVAGAFEPGRFLDLIGNFLSYSAERGGSVDTVLLAKPHQFHAVNKAIEATIRAVATDGRAGVVWHTQGSGKSKEMEFYASKVLKHPALGNPTVLVLTDRLDLDDQLYRTFSASELLPEAPVQASTRDDLRETLDRPSGGIVFSTLQKFGLPAEDVKRGIRHPVVSPRRNVIVIVDEAHRSHYDFEDGLARNLHDALPNATFIAFTGTPISRADADTRAVFGPDIDVYDLTRAVDDGATVPVFYENRHIPVNLPGDVDTDDLDDRAQDVTAELGDEERRRADRAFAKIEHVLGAPERLRELAEDIVAHWVARRAEMRKTTGVAGKAMIVCQSRYICARLYEEIVNLPLPREESWDDPDDDRGVIKAVYTGVPGEDLPVGAHVRTAARLKAIQRRMKNESDPLELVIVQSLWLTGFDAPPLHTLYLDKLMRGASLMQALARVNRRFRDKPHGLVVDYIGVASDLTAALAEYTVDDQQGRPVGRPAESAVDMVMELHSVVAAQIGGSPWRETLSTGSPRSYEDAVTSAAAYLKRPEPDLDEGKPNAEQRFLKSVRDLQRAFALQPRAQALKPLIDDIRFFERVRIRLVKWDAEARLERGETSAADVDFLIRQLTAGVVAADEVIDIYQAAGLERPDLSHLDENFVRRIRQSRHPELALEALRRAIEREIRSVNPHNLVRQRTFTERLLATMRRYTNGALTSAEIINELVSMAREVSADRGRAAELGLSGDELAFYDAVAANESAVRQMGSNKLAEIAKGLVAAVHKDRAVDWSKREQVQARLRSKIKRLLAVHGYPPDAAMAAVELVLQQAETFVDDDTNLTK
ncbi:type I restriction endonuclease subunit R [Amycolatopsis oliviviridis]|uniref:Type I restriction enzyme endonuclease subunit n=1 Tax=Amycolatopsis oliviviridis TaxID=1471590 RepID=A0ABQ3LRW8_9PSEU|nr:type I restriction endonuclease subunit R [Amycolatopsis oliviviridis]GHH22937.1 DEAD/DEAH box helicase [Amycolatopsis oliviviridis]